jgi:hypothetical protein
LLLQEIMALLRHELIGSRVQQLMLSEQY